MAAGVALKAAVLLAYSLLAVCEDEASGLGDLQR